MFWGTRYPNQGWLESMGRRSWPGFQSWYMAGSCHCTLLQGIAPVTSLFGKKCRMLLAQGKRFSLKSQCTGHWSRSRLQCLGLTCFEASYLCTSWDWRIAPCSHQSGYSINYPHVDRMVLIWLFPPPFLNISYSSIEFIFCVCCNSYGLLNTETRINFFLSSLLDRGGSSPRRPLFLHAISFEWPEKL